MLLEMTTTVDPAFSVSKPMNDPAFRPLLETPVARLPISVPACTGVKSPAPPTLSRNVAPLPTVMFTGTQLAAAALYSAAGFVIWNTPLLMVVGPV